MRYKTFLAEVKASTLYRSRAISPDDFNEGVQKHCKKMLKAVESGIGLWRGLDNDNPWLYVDPSTRNRVTGGLPLLYTLLMDNHPTWKNYPKRNHAIIGTNNDRDARGFGDVYLVFPKDGSNYGVSPDNDLWYSFKDFRLTQLVDDIRKMASSLYAGDSYRAKTYKDLQKFLKNLDVRIAEWSEKNGRIPFYGNNDYLEKNYKGDMFDMIAKLMEPKRNGFYHTTDPSKLPKPGSGREIWTDGECYMIHDTEWRGIDEISRTSTT